MNINSNFLYKESVILGSFIEEKTKMNFDKFDVVVYVLKNCTLHFEKL